MLSLALSTIAVLIAADTGEQKGDTAPKIYARSAMKLGQTSRAVRSADELAKLTQASGSLAKSLKVESIDWKKQMLIVVSGGSRPTGGYSVDVQSLEVKEKKLIVHWKLKSPGPGSIVTQAFTHPMQVILVDRFEGDVVFDPAVPPKK